MDYIPNNNVFVAISLLFRTLQGFAAAIGTTALYSFLLLEKDEDKKNYNISLCLFSARIGFAIGPLVTSFLIIPDDVEKNITLGKKVENDIKDLVNINVTLPFIIVSVLMIIPLAICFYYDLDSFYKDSKIDENVETKDKIINGQQNDEISNLDKTSDKDSSEGHFENSKNDELKLLVNDSKNNEEININNEKTNKEKNQIPIFFCCSDFVIKIPF